jgi:hypothetical protein
MGYARLRRHEHVTYAARFVRADINIYKIRNVK